MSLLIEQLTKEASENQETTQQETSEQETSVEKTAEEIAMEKIAHEINVLDQSRTLVAIGEEMYKIAEELQDEAFAALAIDTYQAGERMGACLTKTASEDGSALVEALEIAEDMHKLASVYAELADETQDEALCKMAEAIIEISNELTEDANEFYKLAAEEEGSEEGSTSEESSTSEEGSVEGSTSEASSEEGSEEGVEKEASLKLKLLHAFNKARKTPAGKAVASGGKEVKEAFSGKKVKEFFNQKANTGEISTNAKMSEKLKGLFGTKEGLKAAAPAAVAYGSTAAALTAAGYGVSKKKK